MPAAFTVGTRKQCEYARILRQSLANAICQWRDHEKQSADEDRAEFLDDMIDELLTTPDAPRWIDLFGYCAPRGKPIDYERLDIVLRRRERNCSFAVVRHRLRRQEEQARKRYDREIQELREAADREIAALKAG